MNRIIKKMTVVFLSLAITLLAFPAGILTAYAGAGKITFSDPTASVGNQVSVTIYMAYIQCVIWIGCRWQINIQNFV